jgi:hypothetical protein
VRCSLASQSVTYPENMNKKRFLTLSIPKSAKIIFYNLILLLPGSFSISAETRNLPSPDEVQRIWIQPHDNKLKDFFTSESLLKALLHLRRANIGKSMTFGKVWLWQAERDYLSEKRKKIHWKSFTDNIVLINTDDGSVFYTDIESQTSDFVDGKIIRTIYTREGPKEVMIDLY